MVVFGRKLWELKLRLATLEERILATERERDKLAHDYEVLNVDFKRLVDLLGNAQGGRPIQRADFELDPYKEDEKQPDHWLSPGEDETPNIRAIEQKLDAQEDLIPDGSDG